MKRLCVFAGSNSGSRPAYVAAAQELGRSLVRRNIGLVYGGARVGLMGALADAVMTAHGHVTGVMPEALVAKEVAHNGLSDFRVVASMHERKAMMADAGVVARSDRRLRSADRRQVDLAELHRQTFD